MDFPKLLPAAIDDFIRFLEGHDLQVLIVGGAPRDFYRGIKEIQDWDLEVRSTVPRQSDDFLSTIDRAITSWRGLDRFELLSFEVRRVYAKEGPSFEVAPARLEIYEERQVFGHKDFQIEVIPNPTDEQAFARRDFSINALGLIRQKNGEWRWVDPFGGRQAIDDKQLVPVHTHFTRDPMRFVRALRFHCLLGYEFAPSLKQSFAEFSLRKVSARPFFEELIKARQLEVFPLLMMIVDQKKIELSPALKKWSFLRLAKISGPISQLGQLWIALCCGLHPELVQEALEQHKKELISDLGLKQKESLALLRWGRWAREKQLTSFQGLSATNLSESLEGQELRQFTQWLIQSEHQTFLENAEDWFNWAKAVQHHYEQQKLAGGLDPKLMYYHAMAQVLKEKNP